MEEPNEIVKKLFDDVYVCINAVEKALPSIIMEQNAIEAALVVDSMPKNYITERQTTIIHHNLYI